MFNEIKEIEEATNVIDHYIALLQVYGYMVIINNYALGDYHNITIYKNTQVQRKWWWFFAPETMLESTRIYDTQLCLPSELDALVSIFKSVLLMEPRYEK